MASKTQHLGRYVVVKPRADGSARVYFQVPERLRPEKWPAAIPLPRTGERTGRLGAEEVAAITRDAAELYARFLQQRMGDVERPPNRSMATLVGVWQRSDEWRALTEKTREGYGYSITKILKWSKDKGHPDPAILPRAGVLKFLGEFDDRPTTKRQTKKALSLIMEQAINLGWRTDNPVKGIKIKVPKSKAVIWEQEDVDLYVRVARERDMQSLALIILLEWEIGQRLTDVRQFRQGVEYDRARGLFAFRQSKTDEPVSMEVSETLRQMLAESMGNELFLFRNERTGKAYTENRLSQTFRWLRTAVVKAGGRGLLLRQLRHSCVVQLARAGCTVPEIASITGHSLGSVNSILSTYLPRDSTVARNAQVKRGIVKEKVG